MCCGNPSLNPASSLSRVDASHNHPNLSLRNEPYTFATTWASCSRIACVTLLGFVSIWLSLSKILCGHAHCCMTVPVTSPLHTDLLETTTSTTRSYRWWCLTLTWSVMNFEHVAGCQWPVVWSVGGFVGQRSREAAYNKRDRRCSAGAIHCKPVPNIPMLNLLLC